MDDDGKLITITNLTRDVLVFPIPRPGTEKRKSPKYDHLVIGDAADSDEALRERGLRVPQQGVRDPHFTPNPTVRITRAEWDSIGELGHRVLRHYVALGNMTIEPLPEAA